MTLGDIWERFNIDHPADFKGHSLSVSDIVVLHQNDEDTAHYVDSIGFQQVPEFLQEQQTPVFDKLPPEQQQALSDTVQDTLQMLVDADKRIYGDVTGKTLEAIAAQGYSYKDGQLEKQQPEATPDSLMTGETVRTPRGNFHITDMSREQIEAAGFGFHHASEDGKYLIMGNGTQAYAIAAEQPQRDNPLKHVEDTIEQNDNNFDGLINNTPQTPTVADFEQRAKAGEANFRYRPCKSGKSRETGTAAEKTVHFEEAGRIQETGRRSSRKINRKSIKRIGGLNSMNNPLYH